MRILLLIGQAALGGHVFSTLTTAKALQAKGHEVYLGAGKGELVDEIRKQGIRYVEIPFFLSYFKQDYAYFSFLSWRTIKEVLSFVKREQMDIIHAFDMPASIIANFVRAINGVSVVTTICGGPGHAYPLPRFQRLIAFSEEYKNVMIDKFGWEKEKIVVVRNRIDFKENMLEKQEDIHKFGFIKEHRKIMLVSRFSGEKVKAVEYVLEAAEDILTIMPNLDLILIGYGECYEKIMLCARQINKKIGRNGVILTGPVINANLYLRYGDIIIGVGRSAFEGMFWKKSTIIVGENGFAGVVEKNTVEELGYYNFSGRNVKEFVKPVELRRIILKILEDKEYALRTGEFGREYLEHELDILQGVEKIERVYMDTLQEGVDLKIRLKTFIFLIWNTSRFLFDGIITENPISCYLQKYWKKHG